MSRAAGLAAALSAKNAQRKSAERWRMTRRETTSRVRCQRFRIRRAVTKTGMTGRTGANMTTTLSREERNRACLAEHLAAENAHDVDRIVATYADPALVVVNGRRIEGV